MHGHVESVPTLIVVPVRAESADEIEPILQTLASLRATAPEAMVLVVDDRSPDAHARMIEIAAEELDCAYVLQQDGEGRSAAINVGLSAAYEHGMDVCLVASGLVLETRRLARPPARPHRHRRRRPPRSPAAPSSSPTALIRQAGYFFSLFRRLWSARLRPRAAGGARRPAAAAVPGLQRAAAHPPRVDRVASASTTSCSTARTPRWTTACASARPAASACSSPASAPARSHSSDGEPDDADAVGRAACASSTSASTSSTGSRRSSDASDPEDAVRRLGRQRGLVLPLLPAGRRARRRLRRLGRRRAGHPPR